MSMSDRDVIMMTPTLRILIHFPLEPLAPNHLTPVCLESKFTIVWYFSLLYFFRNTKFKG